MAEANETPAPRRFSDRILMLLVSGSTRFFERIPLDRAVAIGAGLGRTWFRFGAPRVRRVREQIDEAFGDFDRAQRAAWARDVFVHLGRGLVELILLLGRHRAELLDRVRVDGLENLEAAVARSPNRGVLIVTAHLGNWELACARIASLGFPVSVVHRGLLPAALEAKLFAVRGGLERVEGIAMGRSAGLHVLRALEAGRHVIVLLDQNARRKEGLFVDFFGRPACTRSGPLRLARRRAIPILPAFIRRDADARGHSVVFYPALQLESGPSNDEEALRRDVQLVTTVIEKEIRVSPEQWVWTHRRWRTQPLDDERTPAMH